MPILDGNLEIWLFSSKWINWSIELSYKKIKAYEVLNIFNNEFSTVIRRSGIFSMITQEGNSLIIDLRLLWNTIDSSN